MWGLKPPRQRAAESDTLAAVKLDSNLDAVLHRLARRPRDIRAALQRTLAPAAWEEPLRAEAAKTLWALAKPEEWPFVKGFLAAILVAPWLNGFFARMGNPLPPTLTLLDFQLARDVQQHGLEAGRGPTLFSDFLNQFDQLVVEWVATEKRKDRRDWEKSDEEIGQWIGHLLLSSESQLSDQPSAPGRVSEREARRRLLPHLVEWLQKRQAERRLPNETINRWLLAVLAAWSALVRRELPIAFQAHYVAVAAEL